MRTLICAALTAALLGAAPASGAAQTPDSPLEVAYQLVGDSGGTGPAEGVSVTLLFRHDGAALLYVAGDEADDVLTRRGTWRYAGGGLSLAFGADDFRHDVTVPLDLARERVTFPFQVFGDGPGTSEWVRRELWLPAAIIAVFQASVVDDTRALTPDQAVDLAYRYAQARVRAAATARLERARALEVASSGPSADWPEAREAAVTRAAANEFTQVRLLPDGVLLETETRRRMQIALLGWAAPGNTAPLSASPLSNDPRVHLNVAPTGQTQGDPPVKRALLVAPFRNGRSLSKWDGLGWISGAHFSASTNFQLDEAASTLRSRGYEVTVLQDEAVDVVGLIRAIEGKGSQAPGFLLFNTHGAANGALSLGVRLGSDKETIEANDWRLWYEEVGRIEAAGYGDLLTFNGGTRDEPTTVNVISFPTDNHPDKISVFVAVLPDFWEWLRTRRGIDFGQSFVYIAACYTDHTPELREAIRSRAYFAWNESVAPHLMGAVFQYFVSAMARPSRSAEEAYYNLIRVATTRQMIYTEDRLLNGRLGDAGAAAAPRLPDILLGYGSDGGPPIPYQTNGWLDRSRIDQGQVWWMTFAGRWGQDADVGVQRLLECWDEGWAFKQSPGLKSPFCTNASAGGAPTQDEVAYATYLLMGRPMLPFGGRLVPRFTLNESLP